MFTIKGFQGKEPTFPKMNEDVKLCCSNIHNGDRDSAMAKEDGDAAYLCVNPI